VTAGLALALALSGCGSAFVDPGPDPGTLHERGLTLILRVQDADGSAIGNAQVFVDGRRDDWRTDSDFSPLGAGFPTSWQDFLVNWVSDAWAVYDDGIPTTHHFDLAVRKVGWTEDVSIVNIPDSNADHFFVRDVMILYPEGSGGAPPDLHYAEVLADYGPAAAAAAAGQPRKLIRPPGG